MHDEVIVPTFLSRVRRHYVEPTTVPGRMRELARVARAKLITRTIWALSGNSSSTIPTLLITDSQMTEFKKTSGEISSIEEMLSSLSDDPSTPPPERLTRFSTLKVKCRHQYARVLIGKEQPAAVFKRV